MPHLISGSNIGGAEPCAQRPYSGFAIGVDRSQGPFRGFLPRKTTPRDLYQATVIAKPPQNDSYVCIES
jgi:hypothetical protein